MRNLVRWTRWTRTAVLAVGCLTGSATFAQGQHDVVFATDSAEYFGDPLPALQLLVRQKSAPRVARHHFCIVGFESPDSSRRAWVLWFEARRMLLWDGATDPVSARAALVHARRTIDLRTDVVKDQSALAGSGYLVTRAWVDELRSVCATRGQAYIVNGSGKQGALQR